MGGLLTGESNVVYTAPTSAGKSLVADILTIRKVVNERRKAIIVLPYIAIVQEKTRFLKRVLEKVRVAVPKRGRWDKVNLWKHLNIVGFHGGSTVRIGWKELDIAVCTIEKVRRIRIRRIVPADCGHMAEISVCGDARQTHLSMLRLKIAP